MAKFDSMDIGHAKYFYIRAAVLIGIILLGYVIFVTVTNRTNRMVNLEMIGSPVSTRLNSDALTITSWNIGYGALGSESDFIADGGDHFLPPSGDVVEKNLRGIVGMLGQLKSDIIILQEVARPSFLTRGKDTLGAVNAALSGRDNAFSTDFSLSGLPSSFAPEHGLYSSINIAEAMRDIVSLPLEPGYILSLAKRRYHLHIVRIPTDDARWTIINLHLSAFDLDANIRTKQLEAVIDFAEAEFNQGNHVIIGGDWNLEFARPSRPSTTAEKDLFWIHPFPTKVLGKDWQTAIDETVPTVRTNERPYEAGENFTTIIDGFVVSPNVSIESVITRDTDFEFTDHHPVTATFRAHGSP